MMDLTFQMAVLPIVFMFHDFEEIIFFKTWLEKHRQLLGNKFPKLSRRILPGLEKLSTAGFSLAVAEEFILLSVITYVSIYLGNYFLWFAAFMAFSLHLLIHVVQWLIMRIYIPCIVTSLLCLPYCVYTLAGFLSADILDLSQIFLSTMVGLVVMVLNLVLAHKLALRFEQWKVNWLNR